MDNKAYQNSNKYCNKYRNKYHNKYHSKFHNKAYKSFLDLVPAISEHQRWIADDDGFVKVIIERNKPLDRIVRAFMHTPEEYKINLDKVGSFVWKAIDGSRSVDDIAMLLKSRFGESVEPLYNRLFVFFKILANNRFVRFR